MEKHRTEGVWLTRLLAIVFFLSGLSSLVYQVAWQRLLTLHYGVEAISITLIVSVYLLGLGLGALLGGFVAERARGLLTVYFVVELAIGAFGAVSHPLLHFLGDRSAGSSHFLSLLYMSLFLCLPTLLMGATLPLLTKIFNRLVRDFLESVSWLYFVNTLGAAIGALLASYVVISLFGIDTAIRFAASLNLLLAVLVLVARARGAWRLGERRAGEASRLPSRAPAYEVLGRVAHLLVFVTGFLAIGYEIAWFRVVGVLVKASPYAFSTVLFVYLLGIALGSLAMNAWLRRGMQLGRKELFFLLQGLIGLYVMALFIAYPLAIRHTPLEALSRISFAQELHPPFLAPSTESAAHFLQGVYRLADVFFWPLVFVFPPTLAMGASFPLISSLALTREDREGATIGSVYFTSVVGNVTGGVVTGFALLPLLGTERTLLIFSSAGIAFLLFAGRLGHRRIPVAARLAAVLTLAGLNVAFAPRAGAVYDAMHVSPGGEFEAYFEEGIDGVVMTYRRGERVVNYINGLGHGGRPNLFFYVETIEAAAHARRVANVLVIGYGTGANTETILYLDEVEKLTLVELNRALMANLSKMDLFRDLLSDPRIDLVIEDGRRHLLRTQELYDLIMIDPLRSTTAYSNNLYSREFFELAARRLAPGGVMMVWIDEWKVLPRTFSQAFPELRMYDAFLLGAHAPMVRNRDRARRLLRRFPEPWRPRIRQGRRYLGDRAFVMERTRGYPINLDWKPVCEYYLGLRLREALLPPGGAP